MCIYHGSPEERTEIRRTQMVLPQRDREKYWLGAGGAAVSKTTAPRNKSRGRPKKTGPPKASSSKPKPSSRNGKSPGRSTRSRKTFKIEDEDEDEDQDQAVQEANAETNTKPDGDDKSDLPPNQHTTFPVVLTTFEIVMKDRAELSMYKWGFVVVDEGHRLKNMECRLMRELKALPASGRMVLTGTPLHVCISFFLYIEAVWLKTV